MYICKTLENYFEENVDREVTWDSILDADKVGIGGELISHFATSAGWPISTRQILNPN